MRRFHGVSAVPTDNQLARSWVLDADKCSAECCVCCHAMPAVQSFVGCRDNAGEFVDVKCSALVCKKVTVTLDINNPVEFPAEFRLFLWCEFVERFKVARLIVCGDCVCHGVVLCVCLCVLDVQ